MAKIVEGQDYVRGKWHERDEEQPEKPGEPVDNLMCTRCAFDSLFDEQMQRHYDTARSSKGHRHSWVRDPESAKMVKGLQEAFQVGGKQ